MKKSYIIVLVLILLLPTIAFADVLTPSMSFTLPNGFYVDFEVPMMCNLDNEECPDHNIMVTNEVLREGWYPYSNALHHYRYFRKALCLTCHTEYTNVYTADEPVRHSYTVQLQWLDYEYEQHLVEYYCSICKNTVVRYYGCNLFKLNSLGCACPQDYYAD